MYPTYRYFAIWLIVMVVAVLGKYIVIEYLDPSAGIVEWFIGFKVSNSKGL